MKKYLYIAGILLTAYVSVAQQTISLSSRDAGFTIENDNFQGFTASCSFGEITFQNIEIEDVVFDKLAIAGAFPGGEIGAPELPVFKQMIAVPVGAKPKIVVKSFTTTEYDLDEKGIKRIVPVQPPLLQGEEENVQPLFINAENYSINEYNRSSVAYISELGTMRGVRLGMIFINPVRYNPEANTLLVYNDIEFEVIFENADFAATQSLYRQTFSPHFTKLYKNTFNRGVYEDHPDLYQTPVHMLVVADRMFEEALQPWIAWKTIMGYYLDVHYTDEIGTTASAIQTFCHQKYNTGVAAGKTPTFLIIVGDTQHVPASASGVATGKGTDLYYASVDGDYFPEMYFSRMSARTPQDLTNIVDKVINYEKFSFQYPNYLDNAYLAVGIDQDWNQTIGRPQMFYALNNYFTEENGYQWVNYYYGEQKAPDYEPTYYHYRNYAGHCNDTMWSFPTVFQSHISGYENYGHYYVVMANCHSTGNFEFEECFGETMIRAENRAAIAYVGSAAETFWYENFHFVTGAYAAVGDGSMPQIGNTTMGFYDAMFDEDAFHSLSSNVFAGNLAVTYAAENGYPLSSTAGNSAQYYWEAYNVLGDGSITPYRAKPQDNEVVHGNIFPTGISTFPMYTSPGSYVAISQDGVLLGTYFSIHGSAYVPINPPITEGFVDLIVTKNGCKPYIVRLPVGVETDPYMVYAGWETVDGDSLNYRSQQKEIAVSLENIGKITASSTNLTISCDDPQLTIDQAAAQIGIIDTEEIKSAVFKVSVSPEIPNNKVFTIHLTATNSQGSWQFDFPITAYAPELIVERVLVNGLERDLLTPGSVAVLTSVVKNVSAGATAYNVSGKMEIDDPYLSLFCKEQLETLQIGDLGPGESFEFMTAVEVAENIPEGHHPNCFITLSDDFQAETEAVVFPEYPDYEKPGFTNCSSGDVFSKVRMGSINNTNTDCADDGYSDYTHLSTQLRHGKWANELEMRALSNVYAQFWIDWNRNNIFDDDEKYIVSLPLYTGMGPVKVTVPDDAVVGETRMRLRARHLANPPDAYSGWGNYGQTHDYTVIIPEKYERAINVTADVNNNSNSVVVKWDAPAGETPIGYNLYRNGEKINASILTNRTFTDPYMPQGLYMYSVKAIYREEDENGEIVQKESFGRFAEPLCLEDIVYYCNPPEEFTANPNFPAMTVLFSWKRPSESNDLILGYNIYRNGEKINSELLQELSYFDSGLEKKKYEYYTTVSYKNCEESEPSNKIILDFESGTNISDIAAENFKIYPNPASNSVVFEGDGLSKIELFDLQGRLLATYEGFENEFVLKNLNIFAEGVYLVKMYSGDGQFLVKRLTMAR